MRIDPQNPAVAISASSGASGVDSAQASQVKGSQRSASASPNDTVQLSSGQATVRQLVSQLDQVPDVRQDQVNSLRLAISSGQYNPTNSQVAEALVAQSFGASARA